MSNNDIFDDFDASLQCEDVAAYCPSHEEMERIQQEIFERDDESYVVTRVNMASWRIVEIDDPSSIPF